MCRFGCCVVSSIDIALVAVPEQVLVHLVRPRCVVRSVELLYRKRARHASVHSSQSVSSSTYAGCREVLNPRALIPCKECRAEARVKTEDRKKEDTGLMEAWSYAQYAGERERERERENTENYIPKTLTQYSSMYMCVCSMHTYIQDLWRTDRSTIVLQCS